MVNHEIEVKIITTSVSWTHNNNVLEALDELASQVDFGIDAKIWDTNYDQSDATCGDLVEERSKFEEWLDEKNYLKEDEHFMLLTDHSNCGAEGIYKYQIGQNDGQEYEPKKYAISIASVNDSVASYKNTAIQEFCHCIMSKDIGGSCPDESDPEHSCGTVFDDPYTDYKTISPMLSGYEELADIYDWEVCTEHPPYDDYIDTITSCTKYHTETYVDKIGM